MANMGYVRFQNTLRDLQDCYDHLYDDLSDEEAKARDKLVSLCIEIANNEKDNEDDYDVD